jgi:hypothetical protein
MNAAAPEEPSASTSLAEHLRTIHFGLLVLSLALIAITLTPGPGRFERALRQLASIQAVVETWGDGSFFEAAYREGARTNSTLKLNEFVRDSDDLGVFSTGNPGNPPLKLTIATDGRWALEVPEKLMRHLESPPDYGPRGTRQMEFVIPGNGSGRLRKPLTLGQFAEVWDSVGEVAIVVAELDTVSEGKPIVQEYHGPELRVDPFHPAAGESAQAQLDPIANDKLLPTAREVRLRLEPAERINTRRYYFRGFDSGAGSRVVRVAASTPITRVPFFGQASFRRLPGSVELPFVPDASAVPFSKIFAELEDGSTYVSSLTFDELELYLKSEFNRVREQTIELFGARIAGVQVLLVGVPVILALQVYGWIHLTILRRRLRYSTASIAVPWIGLYDTWTARAVTTGSFVLLPALTIVVIEWGRFVRGATPLRIALAFTAVVSVAIAAASLVEFLSLWRSGQSRESNPGRPADDAPPVGV